MPTSQQFSDGIVWGGANRDGHHSTVFRVVRVLSQIGYSIVAIVLGTTPVAATSLFENHTVLDVRLTGPVTTLFDDKKNRTARPFVLTAEGVGYQLDVKLRGQSRLRTCRFPPLRLDFRGADTAATIFAGQKQLKLVTHCRHYDQGEQDMLEEYAAYRILNVLTETSFRVRLLRISYVDTDQKLEQKSALRYGFLLEPDKQLADRLDANIAELRGVPKERHDRRIAALVYVFQYLIGNTDWGLVKADSSDACCHNVRLLERGSRVFFVPYDFDLAGLVNARYASPDPTLRIGRVTQRLYRGLCTNREYLQDALRTVKSRKADILAVLQETPGLAPSSEARARKYLNSFFSKAEDENKLLRSFERRCL